MKHTTRKQKRKGNSYRVGSVDPGIVGVEAELVIPLLDPRVQRAPVLAKAHGEEKLLLGGVAQQKCALLLALEQPLGLVPVHLAPVERAGRYGLEVGHEAVHVVDLPIRVSLGLIRGNIVVEWIAVRTAYIAL